ncbi:MAG: hypothetical protein AAFR59_20590, partial [Bacteroidota bacterium]
MKKAIIFSLTLLLSVSFTLAQSAYEKALQEQKERVERKQRQQKVRRDLALENQQKRIWLKQSLQKGTPQPQIDEPENPRTFDPDNDTRLQFDQIITTPEQDEPFADYQTDVTSRPASPLRLDPEVDEEMRTEIAGLEAQ